MLTIALTGGIACGKTTVAGMLAALGASIIDADAISRSLTAPGGAALPGIRDAFGSGVFHADGTLNRAALSSAVFGKPEALQTLNAITHPLILQQMIAQRDACRKAGAQVVVLDVPLLFEAGMQHLGDITVCAAAPREVQLSRLASRDGMAREQALLRIASQMPVEQKAALCDVVIDTHKPLAQLQAEVDSLYRRWLHAARKENA